MGVVVVDDLLSGYRVVVFDPGFEFIEVDGEDSEIDSSRLPEPRASFFDPIGERVLVEDSVGPVVEGLADGSITGCLVVEKRLDRQHGHVDRLFDLLPSELLPCFTGRHGQRGDVAEHHFLFGPQCECGSEDIDCGADPDFFAERIIGLSLGGSDASERSAVEVFTESVAFGDRVGLRVQPIEFVPEQRGILKAVRVGRIVDHPGDLVGLVPVPDLVLASAGEPFDVGLDGLVVDLDSQTIGFAVKQFTEHDILVDAQGLSESGTDGEVVLGAESGLRVDG